MLKYKIVLAGAKNVGKTSLIARFCDNIFDEHMKETIGVAFKRKIIELEEDMVIEVTIWDFSGEEQYRILFPPYIEGSSAALILYDTTRRDTIDDIHNWVNLIDPYGGPDIIKVIIGTKIDLTDQREITREEAEKECGDFKYCSEIIETSSKTGENVGEAFLNVAREIVNKKFHKCKACGKYFSKQINYCSNCGEKADLEGIDT